MKYILAFVRAILLALTTCVLLTPILLVALLKKDSLPFALSVRKLWARITCRLLGVRVDCQETINDYPEAAIFVSNHRSYIDPAIALRSVKALPVAKSEIASWPLIGFAATATGVMWVKRESHESRASTVVTMQKTIENQHSVLIYPEGTTLATPLSGHFKRGSFSLAARMNIPIVPIAIEYKYPEDYWVGTATFLPHFLSCFGKWTTPVQIRFGAPIYNPNADELLTATQEWINAQLPNMQHALREAQ